MTDRQTDITIPFHTNIYYGTASMVRKHDGLKTKMDKPTFLHYLIKAQVSRDMTKSTK